MPHREAESSAARVFDRLGEQQRLAVIYMRRSVIVAVAIATLAIGGAMAAFFAADATSRAEGRRMLLEEHARDREFVAAALARKCALP